EDGNKREQIKIALVGDSAGGNFVASVMYKILESPTKLPHPTGLVLIYPCLNFNITCWMSPSQLSVIRAESTHSIPGVLESKDHLSHKSPLAVVPDVKRKRWRKSSRDDDRTIEERVQVNNNATDHDKNPRSVIGTRLAMTSRMSYFSDRLINPDLMRAMAILYLGPNNYPDFDSDYLLSPIVGPDELLAQFPKTYLLCGEKDPFVDDTVVFAGRIRDAKRRKKQLSNGGKFGEGLRMSDLDKEDKSTDLENCVEVKIIQGVSHAFFQMIQLLPESKGAVK
ncbi:1432_t:CDS:2, partial [Acaulospora morrowiae]